VTACAAVTPVPVTGIVMLPPFDALLMMVIPPATLPAVFGANSAVTTAVCPAARVTAATPVALNPTPLMLPPEMLILEFPPFFSVSCWVAEPFTITFPKARLAGLTLNRREVPTLVPAKTIVMRPSEAVEVSATDPLELPTDSGKKPTVIWAVPPAAIDSGVAAPVTENPFPVAATLEIVSPAEPVFVSWIICVS
jgi:hypothetical protein